MRDKKLRGSWEDLLPGLTFYRHYRADDAVHTGIESEGETLWEDFQAGKSRDERNPILLWTIDLRCRGKNLPQEACEARSWLLDQAPLIKEAFRQLATELEAGMDADPLPLAWNVPGSSRGVRMTIVCTACHRIVGRTMGGIVKGVGEHWEAILKQLGKPLASHLR
jgi:hypothetical protein